MAAAVWARGNWCVMSRRASSLPREDQPRHFGLQPEVRRVAPDQVLLIHTHRGEIKGRLIAAPGVGEEQHLAGAADQCLGLAHDGVRRHRDHRGVQAAAARELWTMD